MYVCFALLQGTFNVNKAFAERMVKDKVEAGSIVNIASVVGESLIYSTQCTKVTTK